MNIVQRRNIIEEAARKVIIRWMRHKMLKFSTYDDGSDDLLLAAEIARYATDALEYSLPESSKLFKPRFESEADKQDYYRGEFTGRRREPPR